MIQTTNLSNLFDIKYGNSLELVNLEICNQFDEDAINFISRTEKNNGISAFVLKNEEAVINPANTITVAVGGSVLSTFLQLQPFYTGFHVLVLHPKHKMTEIELLFYCYCIRMNKYRYNYGRQANKTLKNILVPAEMPKEFSDIDYAKTNTINAKPCLSTSYELNHNNWEWFIYEDLFEIERGKSFDAEKIVSANKTPLVTSSDQNNGWTDLVETPPFHNGNVIGVNRNGSVGYAFYQPLPFSSTEDVHIFTPRFEMNSYIALFLCTLIRKEKYRFSYGRKWGISRMKKSKIKLPVDNNKKPDFQFMENYIKSLPYSSSI
jgi:Type I restriction modification DNA specificity domain